MTTNNDNLITWQGKPTAGKKAIIRKIGYIDRDGRISGFEFDAQGMDIAGISVPLDGREVLIAGYTLDELREIIEGQTNE